VAFALGASFAWSAARAQTFDPKPYEQAVKRELAKVDEGIRQGPFKPDWESLAKHEAAPEWFRDAKFGIYFHWGVYSVPAYGNEWYPRNMHLKAGRGSAYRHHVETYGEPDKFGYHDFVPMFKAEHFDADEWVALFEKAGAQYIGPVAEHHDGYSMWDSDLTPWNVADTGPNRDTMGELAAAARKYGMRFVTTFHHAHNQGHYPRVEGWPTTSDDPKLQMLYGNMPREKFVDLWLAKVAEVIDKYQPDLMWFDSWLDEIPEGVRQKYLAYYFNRAKEWGKDVVVTRKQNDLPLSLSVEDFEKGRANRLTENVWLTDDTISMGSWCYTQDLQIKSTSRVLHDFIDIVSKNGCLLLNISPKADGTIPENQREVLLGMGAWLKVNGEAIYNTRPWLTFGEGPTRLRKGGGFVGNLTYSPQDIRYTRSKDGKTLYAIALGWPEGGKLTLQSVLVENGDGGAVTLLGYDARLKYSVSDAKQLTIEVPPLAEADRPCRYAFVFKLTGFKTALNPDAVAASAGASAARLSNDLTLDASEAGVTGSIQLEEKIPGKQNLGFWDSPEDRAQWRVQIKQPGKYGVSAVVAARSASKLAVEVAGQKLTADVPATGDWDRQQSIEFGTVQIDKAGTCDVIARPADAQHWKAINPWKLELTPSP